MSPENMSKIQKKNFLSINPGVKVPKKVLKKTDLQIVPRINRPKKQFFYDLSGVLNTGSSGM
jgi:hypothetical protein